VYADHIVELRDGGSLTDPSNGQCLCRSHHEIKTPKAILLLSKGIQLDCEVLLATN
jgi:hypothetical protein